MARRWLTDEEERMILLFNQGYSIEQIMILLNRSYMAILARLDKLGHLGFVDEVLE